MNIDWTMNLSSLRTFYHVDTISYRIHVLPLVFSVVKEYTYYHHTMRHYEADVSTPQPVNPEEYLGLPENKKFLPSLQTFYERFAQPSPAPDCISYPVLESLKMTRALQRSILVLRSNGADFQHIEYRLFAFNFRDDTSYPAGNAEEYRFRGGRFSLSETSASITPTYRHHLAFRRIGENGPLSPPDAHLELSSNPQIPGRWASINGEYLLDDIRTLDIEGSLKEKNSTPLGQLALIRTHNALDSRAS